MMKFLKIYNGDIIGGPQLTKSKSLLNNLLIRNEKHGANIKWVSTNNCFVKKKVLESKLFFDKRLNLTGGEDQLFFLKLSRAGFKIKWNTKSKVIEQKNINRENFLWFLKRNFRYGASSNLIYYEAYGYIGGISFLIGKLSLDLFKMIFYLITSVSLSKKKFYKFIMYFCRASGLIFGLLGIQYKEYA